MTEQQNNLLSYIDCRCQTIIHDKQSRSVQPDCALLNEILADTKRDTIECMRELIRSGKYRGAISINQPMLFIK
jgi:hypothetical protein